MRLRAPCGLQCVLRCKNTNYYCISCFVIAKRLLLLHAEFGNQCIKPVSAGVTLAAVIASSNLTLLHMQLFVVTDGYLKSIRKRGDKSVILTKPVVARFFVAIFKS